MSTHPSDHAISAVIIADHLSSELQRCLKSIQWVSEVVIVDPRGTLKKNDLAHYTSLPVQIVAVQGLDDFAAARNTGAQAARYNWILQIDSDEYFTDPEKVSLWWHELSKESALVFSFWRQDIFYGKQLQWGEVREQWHARLYDRAVAHFVQPVHEVLITTVQVRQAPFILLHTAHATFSELMLSVERYAASMAEWKVKQAAAFQSWQLLALPLAKFLQNVLIRQAWRDGWRGIAYAVAMSWHSWLVRAYHYEYSS